mgnify:FL=1
MDAWGFRPEDYAHEVACIWPENLQAFDVFSRLRTQWNVGMNGPTGLRYEAVYPLLDKLAADKDEWLELLADIQVMEAQALETIHPEEG